MKTPRLWTGLTVLACASALAAGCSKKDKKNDGAPASPVEAFVVNQAPTQGGAMIRYRSNVKDAKFKCMLEVDGQAGQWVDCGPEGMQVRLQGGHRYVFKVKAIAPDGRESEPDVYVLGDGGPDQGGELDLQTEILNKRDVSDPFNKPTLRLTFGVSGGQANLDDMRFECKRETDNAFRLCQEKTPGAPDNEYDFGQLEDGKSYSLTVRAVSRDTDFPGTAREDSINFTVRLNRLVIGGEEQLRNQTTGTVNLSFDAARQAGHAVTCSIDDAESKLCTQGMQLPLDRMPPGEHKLRVEARDAGNQIVAQSTVTFCAVQCAGEQAPPVPALQVFQIGSFYSLLVPDNMHVTTLATDKTYDQGQLSFFRVFSGLGASQDPYYVGNYRCQGDFDQQIAAASPSGNVYHYCNSTPPEYLFKTWLTNGRLARNHLAIATDAQAVTEYNHERIMFNAFDRDMDFMMDRSLFEQKCLNERGRIEKTHPIRLINSAFWGEPVRAEFYMCVTNIAGSTGGLPTTEQWWIGGFFLVSEGQTYPLWECFNYDYKAHMAAGGGYDQYGYEPKFCGEYKNPNLLEVVYMSRAPFRRSADFARAAQKRIIPILNELSPLAR